MRTLLIIYTVLLLALLVSRPSFAEASTDSNFTASCKLVTSDIGEIQIKATSKQLAFEKAIETCSNRRLDQYKAVRGQYPSEEQSEDIILSCVNLSCS